MPLNVLVIICDCIETNSSANLCHIAYIKGFVDAGNSVEVICAESKGHTLDSSMKLPDSVVVHKYNGTTLYERVSKLRHSKSSNSIERSTHIDSKRTTIDAITIVDTVKRRIRALYGPYHTHGKMVHEARRFRSDTYYDLVVSLSYPQSSHLLAYRLIHNGNLKTNRWIQIWEDPWYYSIDCEKDNKILREERRLLRFADTILYVSPLTLDYQKAMFPEYAGKMHWVPLPSYYDLKQLSIPKEANNKSVYGYFGDYQPSIRNLGPFYEAACKTGIEAIICGNPSNLFSSTESVKILPRLHLEQLRPMEERADVLVFLCNSGGGQIPGKLYQCSATNKVILFILDGSEEEREVLKEYFSQYNRYIFCDNNINDIIEAIEFIESGNYDESFRAPLAVFQPKEIANRIIDVLNNK